ncbi:MAG: CBS domain-containing protein [Firmicutes bacterium HGW-Firmicutes-7]|nr:MAG: CBS domain-containing protein [Firmicutes bacterium HGW-Firmicutes-7]
MNIAFFLTPKSELVTLEQHITIRQAMEIMEYHRYTSVSVIDKKGRYIDALSEGDILWHLKHKEGLIFKHTEKESIDTIKRYRPTLSVSINSDIESLIELSVTQSFIPVVDDQNVFIGIIKRSDIIHYCIDKLEIKETGERIA